MCPECFASVALLITGVVSTGGVTVAALKILRSKKTAARISAVRNTKIYQSKEKSR